MSVSELWLYHKQTWVKETSNFLDIGERKAQVKNEVFVVISVPRIVSVTHRSLLNICWLNNYTLVVMQLGCVLSVCLSGEASYCPWQYYWTKSLRAQENLLSA